MNIAQESNGWMALVGKEIRKRKAKLDILSF